MTITKRNLPGENFNACPGNSVPGNACPGNSVAGSGFAVDCLSGLMALLCTICCCSPTSAADFFVQKAGVCEVTVHQIHLQNHSTVGRLQGQIAIEMTVKNQSNADLNLDLSKMWATCVEKKISTVRSGRQDSLVPNRVRKIAAGESVTGWLMFGVSHSSSFEPDLTFNMECQGQTLSVPLNKAIRTTSDLTVRGLGPNNVLAVIQLKRPVDGFSIWLLNDRFKQLKQEKVERVIVEYLAVEDTWAISSNSISSNSVDSWLQSAIETQQPTRLPFLNTVRSPVQFHKLFVVQPPTYRRPAYGFVNLRKPDLQSAIAASVRDVFQTVSPAELEAAFASPEAGIRQAAMETNLDRLTADRLQQIFDEAADDADQQKLLARELYRSASPVALQLLNRLARSDNAEVSQAAMSSIMKCASNEVLPLTLALWAEFEGDPVWETDLVNAILKQGDHRMTPILVAYAEKRVRSMTGAPDASHGNDTSASSDTLKTPDSEQEAAVKLPVVPFGNIRVQRSQVATKTLPHVLKFLQKQHDREFEEVARQQVLKISDPETQDDVLSYLLDIKSSNIRHLASAYLTQRLSPLKTESDDLTDEERKRLEQKYAPRSTTVYSKRYSPRLLSTALRFPRSENTDRLLKLSEDRMLNSSSRSLAFNAAILGANAQQMDSILKDFSSLPRMRRSQVLNGLVQLHHPRQLEIAEQNLNQSDESAADTIRQLMQDTSLESTLLAVRYLDKARRSVERKALLSEAPGSAAERLVSTNAESLYSVIHPDVQRFLNRMEKSPVMTFFLAARRAKSRRLRMSRHVATYQQAYQLKEAGKNDEAEELYRAIVEADPYDDSAMTSLASLCMRSNRSEEAMKLLLRARELSPEDVDLESFLSLAMIRLGDVEGGLKLAEETVNQVPDQATSLRTNVLYNTACSYSRAIEQVDDKEQKNAYSEEALRYLHRSIDRENGFDKVEHALADPDLVALHKEAGWKKVIEQMRKKSLDQPN